MLTNVIALPPHGPTTLANDDIKCYTMAQIRAMIAAGDYFPTAPGAPEFELDEDFWRNARIVMPKPAKEAISLPVDRDIIAWLRAKGRGYQSRMNAVLRAFVESRFNEPERQR